MFVGYDDEGLLVDGSVDVVCKWMLFMLLIGVNGDGGYVFISARKSFDVMLCSLEKLNFFEDEIICLGCLLSDMLLVLVFSLFDCISYLINL